MFKNLCDTHTHTIFSRHAYSTIRENVLAAKDCGLELLASTDHYSEMLFTTTDARDFQFFYNLHAWPRVWEGVKLLHGCEADIIDTDGHFFGYDILVPTEINGAYYQEPKTLLSRVLAHCDYVIASVHNRDLFSDSSVAQNTEAYIKALNHPLTLEIAHIGRSMVDVEFKPIVEEAARLHKIIEINEHSCDSKNPEIGRRCREVAQLCAELGCYIAINTDAHICTDIGKTPRCFAMLEELHFPQELVATSDAETFLAQRKLALGEDAPVLDFSHTA